MKATARLRTSAVAMLAAVLLVLVIACGSDPVEGTAVAASATAIRREQAIAAFTAEALAASPTATRFPQVTASLPTPVSTVESPSTPSSAQPNASPSPSPTSQALEGQAEEDRLALEALLITRARAMAAGDFDTWYGTCASVVRDTAIENDALGRQLRAMRLDLSETSSVEFVLEQVFFTAGTAATVVWGWRVGPNYFPGVGGGPYIKEDGDWYSMGWGCVG